MKALFFSCHMCGSYNSEILTPAFLADGSFCNFQKIVICKKCGLVYKNPVIPELNKLVYSRDSWGDGTTFKKRISKLVSYLSDFLKINAPRTIIEIGPGPGWLSMALKEILPNSKYLLFEASEDVAQVTIQNMPDSTVIPSSIEEVHINNNFVDLAIVCGVDYLFSDFRSTIIKIHSSIANNGYLYIERNVFVETEAYVGFPIKTFKDLFGANVLMTTWFALDQYRQLLTLFFDVVSERSFLHDETDGFKCIINGFLCKKKNVSSEYYNGSTSWYETNMTSLGRLKKDTITTGSAKPQPKKISDKLLSVLQLWRLNK